MEITPHKAFYRGKMTCKSRIGGHLWPILLCVTVFFSAGVHRCICESNNDEINMVILNSVVRDYGTDGTLSFQELETFLTEQSTDHKTSADNSRYRSRGGNNTNSLTVLSNLTVQDAQTFHCFTLHDVFEFYNLPSVSSINVTFLQEMAPALLYMLKHKCVRRINMYERDSMENHMAPSPLSVWGYGFLMVTVINLCSLVGVIVLPFMKMTVYKQILIFMVALAVGALAGSGLLFLIPEAFGLVSEDGTDLDYIFKASTVMCGIYLFYLTEKIMRMVTNWKERRNLRCKSPTIPHGRDEDDHQHVMEIICSVKKNTPVSQDVMYKETATLPSSVSTCTHEELLEKSSDDSNYCKDNDTSDVRDVAERYENSVSAESSRYGQHVIKPLAWMIIFGDGLHNFIDGLSIGTAFTQSILAGVSVAVAVMCEELPHELGDFAILLNCGMSVKKALLYNFLSACMCYLGLIIGILLGENTSSHDWIFAIAGGMFLYISLADMMPEMNSASESKGNSNTKQIFLIQNLGLILGFTIMLVLAIYGSHINFE